MNRIIKSINNNLAKGKSGYILKKKVNVFIPFSVIGLNCLTRNISDINIFYKTILKLLEIGVNDINEIAEIMGITFSIIKEIVVDMIQEQYIQTTINTLKITPKGQQALSSGKLIEIRKKYINDIVIDLITGEIRSYSEIKRAIVQKNSVCLSEEFKVTNEFLISKYQELNKVYNKILQGESMINNNTNKEIYKILEIDYKNLIYVKNILFIYENEENGEFQLEFQNDINEQYLDCFCNQIKDNTPPCMEYFFEKSISYLKNYEKMTIDNNTEARKNTEELKALLNKSDEITNEIYDKFCSKRYMLDNTEHKYYFEYFNILKFDKLIVFSNRINSILNSGNLYDNIATISKYKPVFIAYSDTEYYANNIVNKIAEKCDKKNLNKINIISNSSFICFYPTLLIEIYEPVAQIFEKKITYKEGLLNFSEKEIRDFISRIEIDNNISFDIKAEIKNETVINNLHTRIKTNKKFKG